MPEHLRALIIILPLASLVFWLARQPLSTLIEQERFIRWRNIWLGLTLVAFLSYSFWIYTFIVAGVLLLQRSKESNPIALYFFLLFLIPPAPAYISGFGLVNYLVALDHPRLLALCILLPSMLNLRQSESNARFGATLADKLLICYSLLTIAMQFRGMGLTDTLRVAFYTWTDVFLPYYVASRSLKNLRQFREAMAGFLLACMLLAAIGFFEFSRHWLLYSSLVPALDLSWGLAGYLGRADMLRATATTGQAIVLGYVLATAIGVYLFLQYFIKQRRHQRLGWLLLFAGIISPLSRGPWIGGVAILTIFLATGRNALGSITKMLGVAFLAFSVSAFMPGGEKIINLIPFIGTTEKANIDYRDKLFDNSLIVIQKNLYLGSVNYLETPEMLEMIQGQGIIDIVNSYIAIALNYGIVGLGLFLMFFFSILLRTFRIVRSFSDPDDETARLGRALLATLSGILITISTVSSISFIPIIYWAVAGVCVAYARMTDNAKEEMRSVQI